MIAKEWCISSGVGVSEKGLPSFDRALMNAGVGNYNLVRLSSILPAHCRWIDVSEISEHIREGSLLPTAYSTITSDVEGETIVSSIGVGIPRNCNNVGVIMEYSDKNISEDQAREMLHSMIREAFEIREWELDGIVDTVVSDKVDKGGIKHTTFACISEW